MLRRVRNLWFIIMSILLIFFNIFYNKELLALNDSKLNAFIFIHCGLYIIYITICFNTFETYFHTFHIF